MFEDIFKLASTQGVWASLSIILIIYITKTQDRRDQIQEKRESEYQRIITELIEKMDILKNLYDHILEIKSRIK